MTPHDDRETALDAARDRIGRRLQESLDRLRDDIARVEFWADVLDGFNRPVERYEQSAIPLDRYLLPPQSDGGDEPARRPRHDRRAHR